MGRIGKVISLIGICGLTTTGAAASAATQGQAHPDAMTVVETGTIAAIYAGRCDEPERGEPIAELTPLAAPSGKHVGSALAEAAAKSSTRRVPHALHELLADPHIVGVRGSTAPPGELLACGEIDAELTSRGELIIGLRELKASGWTGIAYLAPNRADRSRTDVTIFVSANLTASSEEGAAAPTPVAYWSFDGTSCPPAGDGVDHGLAATCGQGVILGHACAVPATNSPAARFDGSGDAYVDVGDVLDFAGEFAFSLEAWIAPSRIPTGTHPRIIQKEGTDADALRQGYVLFLDGGTGQIGFERWRDGAKEGVVSAVPIPIDAAAHVVATYDGELMRLFLDGVEVASAPSAQPLLDTAFPFRIGNSNDGGSPFAGSIDEVAVYDVALDQETVVARYQAGLGRPSSLPGTASALTPCR